MMLRWWQKTGHKPIVLMGGGTTKVGDPSGRDETRQLLTDEAIDGQHGRASGACSTSTSRSATARPTR